MQRVLEEYASCTRAACVLASSGLLGAAALPCVKLLIMLRVCPDTPACEESAQTVGWCGLG